MEKMIAFQSPSKGSQHVNNILYRRVNDSAKRSACHIAPDAKLCPEKVVSQPYSPLRMRQTPEDPIAPPTLDPGRTGVGKPRQATPGQSSVSGLHVGNKRADGSGKSASAKRRQKAVAVAAVDRKSGATTTTRAQAQFPASAKSTRPQASQLKTRIYAAKPSPAAVPEKPNRRRAHTKVC